MRSVDPASSRAVEPVYRALWTGLHRVVAPRTLGSLVKYFSPTWRECLVCYDLPADARRLALTIDDAPSDAALMGALLDVLSLEGVKATFFVVSTFAQSSPERLETLRRAVREGHELGNHLTVDESAAEMSPAAFETALLDCEALIASIDAEWPRRKRRWFRPPRGYMCQHMSRTLIKHNYTAVLADVFPLDTEVRSVSWLVRFVLQHAKPGSIILLHAPDRRVTKGRSHERQNNVTVLARLLPLLRDAKFQTGTLSDLAQVHDDYRAGVARQAAAINAQPPASQVAV